MVPIAHVVDHDHGLPETQAGQRARCRAEKAEDLICDSANDVNYLAGRCVAPMPSTTVAGRLAKGFRDR
jgi:hypothetical protein